MQDKLVFILTTIVRILITFLTFTPVLVFTTRYFLTLELVPLHYYVLMTPFMVVFVKEVKTTPKRVKSVIEMNRLNKELNNFLDKFGSDKDDKR